MQYDYYMSNPRYHTYSGIGVAKTYYDGTTHIRKVIESGIYKKQLSTNGINWLDLDPTITITDTLVRNGVLDGNWYIDDWNVSAWEHLEGPTSGGGIGKFRDGVRENAYVLDEALTSLGWDGIEGTDWVNLQMNKLS